MGEPGEGEVRVKNNAIGVNFIDVYFRTGLYKAELPFTPGMHGFMKPNRPLYPSLISCFMYMFIEDKCNVHSPHMQ